MNLVEITVRTKDQATSQFKAVEKAAKDSGAASGRGFSDGFKRAAGGKGLLSGMFDRNGGEKAGRDTGDSFVNGFKGALTKRKGELAKFMSDLLGKGGGGKGADALNAGGVAGGALPGIMGLSGKHATMLGLGGVALGAFPALAAVQATAGLAGLGGSLISTGAQQLIGQKNTKANPNAQGPLYDQAQAAGKALQGALKSAASGMLGPLKQAFSAIPGLVKQIEPALKSVFAGVGTLIKPLLQGVASIAKQVLPLLGQAFKAVGPLITPLLSGLGGLIKGILPGLITMLKAAKPAIDAFASVLGTLGKDLGSMFAGFAPVLGASSQIFKALGGILAALLPIIGKLAGEFAKTLGPVFGQLAGVVKSLLPVLSVVGGVLANLASAVVGDLGSVFGAVATLVKDLGPSLAILAKAFGQVFNVLENSGVFAILGDALENLAPVIAKLINTLISGLAPVFPVLIQAVAQLSTIIVSLLSAGLLTLLNAVIPLVGWLAKVVTAVILWLEKSHLLLPILAAVAIAINPVGAAVVGVIAVIGLLATHWRQIWGDVKKWTEDAIKFLERLFHGLPQPLQDALKIYADIWKISFDVVIGTVREAVAIISGVLKVAWDLIAGVAKAAWAYISGSFKIAFDIIVGSFKVFVDLLTGNWRGAMNAIKATGVQVWNAVKGALAGIWNAMKGAAEGVWNAMKSAASGVWNAMKSTAVQVWNAIKGALSAVWDGMKSAAAAVWNAMKAAAVGDWNGIKSSLSGVWNAMKGAAAAVWNAMKSAASAAWNAMKSAAVSTWNGIRSALSGVWNGMKSAAASVWNAMKSSASSLWSALKSGFNSVVSAIGSAWGRLTGVFKAPVNFLINTVYMGGIRRLWDDVMNAIGLSSLDLPSVKGLAGGGKLPGYGGGDQHLRLLESGEAVVDKDRTRKFAPLLAAMGVPGMAKGGLVGDAIDVGKMTLAAATGNQVAFVNAFKDFLPHGGGAGGNLAAMMATLPVSMIKHIVSGVWDKITGAATASSPAGGGGGGGSSSGGVTRWAPQIKQALSMLHQPGSDLGPVEHRMQQESGGNPTIVNKWDSNWTAGHPSVGLMQVIRGTYQAYSGQFRNTGPFEYGVSVNPLANIYAGLHYAISAYRGRSLASVMMQPGGYAGGGATSAGWAMVGERGRELIKVPGGATVYPHGAANSMLAAGSGGPVLVQLEITGGQSATEQFLLKILREQVRVKGGGSVQKAFGVPGK